MDTLLPEASKHADSIIRAGMQQLPNNPYMIILYSSFLIDVQGSYQSGYSQLQTAKKAEPRCAVQRACLDLISLINSIHQLLIYDLVIRCCMDY